MSTGSSKAYKGMGMDGVIATWYTRNTEKVIDEFRADARRIAALVPEGSDILEVAPGPGFLSIELAKLGQYGITGLDISEKFVEIARQKAETAGVKIDFRQGNASDMPFEDERFDFIVCRSAFKNFSQPRRAIDEMHRVLRPSGRAMILDLRKNLTHEEVDRYVDGMGTGRFDAWITRWTFKRMLIPRAYGREDFEALARQSKFSDYEIREAGLAIEVVLKK